MDQDLTTWQRLEQAVGRWISRPSQRPKTDWVLPAQDDAKAIAAGRRFEAEASYFSIRLVEMGLATGGEFFTSFLPMGVCLTEYRFGDERQRHPLILSNDLIASQIKGTAKPGHVEFANMYAVRQAPVKDDNLSLFVGLFRMPYNDLARQVLQIASDLTQQVGGDAGTLASGLRVADKVYDGVTSLFGLKDVTPLFGYADGNALTASGYLLVRGPAAAEIDGRRLAVVDNQLRLDGARAAGFDYCLVAVEHADSRLPQGSDTIKSLTSLAFHRRFREIGPLLAEKKLVDAEARLAQVRADVVTSPELTEEDRLIAVAAYDTAYDKLKRALVRDGAGATTRSGTRGASLAAELRAEAERRRNADQARAGEILQRVATRLQVRARSDDVDAVFADEAVALRSALADVGRGTAASTATVAEAISGAVARGAEIG